MTEQKKSKDIYSAGQLYSQVARYLNESGNNSFLIPSQVIAALSLELHFKSLFYLEKGADFKINGKYSHNFYSLFKELNDESRQEIKDHFDTLIKNRDMKDIRMMEKTGKIKISLDFDDTLESWSTIFTDVRYLYEEKAKKTMVFFPELEAAVVARITQIMKKLNV